MRKILMAIFFLGLFAAMPAVHAEKEALPGDLSNLYFDGIAYDNKQPEESIAMINGIALHQGDDYRGYKVVEITENHVTVSEAETGETYEISPGDGAANVQKRAAWNPLKDLKMPKLPDMKTSAKGTGGSGQQADKAAQEALKKLNPFNTLNESKARVEKQIDEIKAEQNKRIDLLNNIMDGMETKPQEQKKS